MTVIQQFETTAQNVLKSDISATDKASRLEKLSQVIEKYVNKHERSVLAQATDLERKKLIRVGFGKMRHLAVELKSLSNKIITR